MHGINHGQNELIAFNAPFLRRNSVGIRGKTKTGFLSWLNWLLFRPAAARNPEPLNPEPGTSMWFHTVQREIPCRYVKIQPIRYAKRHRLFDIIYIATGVLSGDRQPDTAIQKGLPHNMQCLVRRIVHFTEVGQDHMFQSAMPDFRQQVL